MNYQKIYDDICKRGQERVLPEEIYVEKHHIIPRCMDGDNSKENLTILTAREHFICHLILARKLFPNHKGMWNALRKMLYYKRSYQDRYVPSGRIYESIRLEVNEKSKGSGNPFYGKSHTDATKQKIKDTRKRNSELGLYSNSTVGKHERTPEYREKISKLNKGKKRSDDVKKQMSESRKGESNHFYGKTHSEDAKKKIRAARKKQTFSEESKQKKIAALSRSPTRQSGEKNPYYGKSYEERYGEERAKEIRKKISEGGKRRYSKSK